MAKTSAVIYVRVSDDKGGRSRSVEDQEAECRAFCRSKRWAVLEVATDSDLSASRYARRSRPGWARVAELVDNGAASAVVAWDVDRMLRQPRELEDLIDRADKGLPVVTLGGGDIKLDTADGRFIARILVAKAAKESDDISRRTKRGKAAAARRGASIGCVRAFGWTDNGATVVHDEADVIRDAMARVLAGESLNSVARLWNEKGHRRPRGGSQWTATTIRDVLTSPRNAGLVQHQGEIIGPASWPAIITRAEREDVLRIVTARATGPRRRGTFTGLFECGRCHKTMSHDSSKGKRIWRCKGRNDGRCGGVAITGPELEKLTLAMFFAAVDDGQIPAPDAGTDADTAGEELAELERRMTELAEDFGNGLISRTEWLAARDAIDGRRAAAAALVTKRKRPVVLDPYLGKPGALEAVWEDLSDAERNTMLLAILDAVVIGPAAGTSVIDDRVADVRWRY